MFYTSGNCAIKSKLVIIIFTIQFFVISSKLNLAHCQSTTNLNLNLPNSNTNTNFQISDNDDDSNDETIGPEVNFTLTSKDKIGEFGDCSYFILFFFSLFFALLHCEVATGRKEGRKERIIERDK